MIDNKMNMKVHQARIFRVNDTNFEKNIGFEKNIIIKRFENTLESKTEQLLFKEFVPASVLVDKCGNIFYVYGSTGGFLELSPGNVGTYNNILKMANAGIVKELRRALHQATLQHKTVFINGWIINNNGLKELIYLSVKPISDNLKALQRQDLFLVIFELAADSGRWLDRFQTLLDWNEYQCLMNNKIFKKKFVIRSDEFEKSPNSQEIELIGVSAELDVVVCEDSTIESQALEHELDQVKDELNKSIFDLDSAKAELEYINQEIAVAQEKLDQIRDFPRQIRRDFDHIKIELKAIKRELSTVGNELSSANQKLNTSLYEIDIAEKELALINSEILNSNTDLEITNRKTIIAKSEYSNEIHKLTGIESFQPGLLMTGKRDDFQLQESKRSENNYTCYRRQLLIEKKSANDSSEFKEIAAVIKGDAKEDTDILEVKCDLMKKVPEKTLGEAQLSLINLSVRNVDKQINEVMRQEKKYLLNLDMSYKCNAYLEKFLNQDIHNGSTGYMIRSLYFDTIDDLDFQDKEDGIEIRRKIRLRIYDVKGDFALLEIKQKQGSQQLKRSLKMNRADAEQLIKGNYSCLLNYSEPFAAESYGIMNMHCYRPRTIVQYNRKAYIAKENKTRVTLDSNIMATESCFDLFSNELCMYPVLDKFNIVIEVKYNGFLLSYIRALINQIDGSELSVSKYCLARGVGYHYNF